MNLFTVWDKIKEMVKRMIGPRTIEQTLEVTPLISSKMIEAIELWSDLYEGKASWVHEPDAGDPVKVVSLGLPAMIASEKARMATIEMKSEITTPVETTIEDNPDYTPPTMDEFGNWYSSGQSKIIQTETPISDTTRAEFLDKQYKKLLKVIRTQLEYGIAKGGLIIKPYIVLHEQEKRLESQNTTFESTSKSLDEYIADIEFDCIQADGYFPLAFDGGGHLTEAAFIQRKVDKNNVYTRLEHHKLEGHKVTIQNRCFKSYNNDTHNSIVGETDLGVEVKLSAVPEWKDLQPTTVIDNVDRLLFGYFKMPEANTIDTHSPLGVSGYSRAINLIREADLQFSRLQWEYEGGQLAIDIDRDALREVTDADGHTHYVNPVLQERLFRQVDIGTNGDTYNPYTPSLRDGAYIQGLNNILMRIEDVCALSRGTLSDAAAEAKTATELKILKQRSYSANADIQNALEDTLRDVVYVMNVYASLYNVTEEGEFDVSFEWDDSIITDVDTELSKRLNLMQNGLASKVETRMWYFGETERQAIEALQKVNEESQEAMEQNMMQMQNKSDNFPKK